MKIVQVGIGGMGSAWLRTIQASDEVEFAAWVEVNDTIADEQAAKYGLDRALIFKTLDEALNVVEADGLIDVTPPQFHRAISLAALDAGIPVLSEKPLADTLDAAQEIVRKADQTGVLHMVAQNYRYSVPAQTVKRLLDSGELGAVGSVAVQFYKGPHFGGFREQMPYPLIIDMAIHHFDMLRFFLDRDPVSVFGRSWNPPWSWFGGDASASVSFGFEGGISASYDGSWCATGRETSWNGSWRLDCEKGVIILDDDAVSVQRWTGVDGFQNVNTEIERVPDVAMPRTAQAYLLHEFYTAVTEGILPATTCQDNIKSLQMVFDVVRSFESGHVV
ncbi:MAG: Gfo/Idh/MocA family oxidoreductase [Anaerolineae bacterium]|nr:Gfo/Idh/MocA family oxidoreductase [Anaerolineae bacterium]